MSDSLRSPQVRIVFVKNASQVAEGLFERFAAKKGLPIENGRLLWQADGVLEEAELVSEERLSSLEALPTIVVLRSTKSSALLTDHEFENGMLALTLEDALKAEGLFLFKKPLEDNQWKLAERSAAIVKVSAEDDLQAWVNALVRAMDLVLRRLDAVRAILAQGQTV